jgi:hypothetical protein
MPGTSGIHDDETVEARGLVIPPWALYLLGAQGTIFVICGLPWSVWVTYTLLTVQFTALSSADGNNIVTKMEARFDKLDGKFESLQREFDRKLSKSE